MGVTQTTEMSEYLFTGVTVDVIAAQAFVLFIAGFETSSTTMTFCLYKLALNPDIQERVRNEIDTVVDRNGENITYECTGMEVLLHGF